MPVLFQKIIRREDLIRNRNVLYVFGDNAERRGMGGQAAEMRGEVNAVGVATKYSASICFGNDPDDIAVQKRIIDQDMKPLFGAVSAGRTVVWPTDGIGTGLARLSEVSPDTYDYLQEKLRGLLAAAQAGSQ